VAAVDEGEAWGFAYGYALDRLHQTDLLLYSIDVLEARRREGIGRAMVERLKAVCAERGCGEMWVVTNASNRAAMRLYASAGGVREFDDVEMFVFPAPDEPRGGGS
jgi:ribosomal protein S18 acetylase RimI-like enzyme